jgi:hypothetical protein
MQLLLRLIKHSRPRGARLMTTQSNKRQPPKVIAQLEIPSINLCFYFHTFAIPRLLRDSVDIPSSDSNLNTPPRCGCHSEQVNLLSLLSSRRPNRHSSTAPYLSQSFHNYGFCCPRTSRIQPLLCFSQYIAFGGTERNDREDNVGPIPGGFRSSSFFPTAVEAFKLGRGVKK